MLDWWIALTLPGQVFACIAIFATVILVIPIILMLVGFGVGADGSDGALESDGADPGDGVFGEGAPEGDDFDADAIDGGLRLFSLRGIVAFLAVMGWTGIILIELEIPHVLSVLISACCGFMAMVLLAILFKAIMKLQDSGNVSLKNAIGLSGSVYLAVPPQREGRGKVNITLQGRYSEYEAITDEEEKIPTGASVIVTGISGGVLIVKPKAKL